MKACLRACLCCVQERSWHQSLTSWFVCALSSPRPPVGSSIGQLAAVDVAAVRGTGGTPAAQSVRPLVPQCKRAAGGHLSVLASLTRVHRLHFQPPPSGSAERGAKDIGACFAGLVLNSGDGGLSSSMLPPSVVAQLSSIWPWLSSAAAAWLSSAAAAESSFTVRPSSVVALSPPHVVALPLPGAPQQSGFEAHIR